MSNESPNGLEQPRPSVVTMARWPLYVAIALGLILFAALVHGIHSTGASTEADKKKVDINEEEKPLAALEGRGLTLAPPNGTPAVIKQEPAKKEPLIVVRGEPANENHVKEREEMRRRRMEAQFAALNSPLEVQLQGSASKQNIKTAQQANPNMPGQPGAMAANGLSVGQAKLPYGLDQLGAQEGAGYDPASAKDKESFLQDRSQPDSSWISPHFRTAGQELEIKTGWVIPAVMVTGINSDLPGSIIAQVGQNVYDSPTGNQLLIPQGSKLFGVYDARVVHGQERVLVAWNRIVFPDGSAMTLGAMPGADMAGYGGFTDEVNNHTWRIFKSALLMSLITGATSYGMDQFGGNGNSDRNIPTFQDQMGTALAGQLGQATTQMLQKNINISPTLEIRPGYQFNIIVTKDLVFEEPYSEWRG